MLVCSFGAGNALNPLTSLPDGFLFGLDQNLSGEFLHYVEAVIGKLRIRKVFAHQCWVSGVHIHRNGCNVSGESAVTESLEKGFYVNQPLPSADPQNTPPLQIHNNGGVRMPLFDADLIEGKTGGTGKIHILESGFELRNVQSLDGALGHAGNTLHLLVVNAAPEQKLDERAETAGDPVAGQHPVR